MNESELIKCIDNDCGVPINIAFAIQKKKKIAYQLGKKSVIIKKENGR